MGVSGICVRELGLGGFQLVVWVGVTMTSDLWSYLWLSHSNSVSCL